MALSVIKRLYLIHMLIYFESLGIKYLHDMNICKFCLAWERKPDGKETLLKKVKKVSNYSTFISDSTGCENAVINRITRAKVEFDLRFRK